MRRPDVSKSPDSRLEFYINKSKCGENGNRKNQIRACVFTANEL